MTTRTTTPAFAGDRMTPAASTRLFLKKEDDDSLFQLPPAPEDQFTMTGDLVVLAVYAFCGHTVNNWIVASTFQDSPNLQEAVHRLDPLGQTVASLQAPVWVESPFLGTQIVTSMAQQELSDQFGPLYATAGTTCVALCACWLMAGWMNRSFSFSKSLDCDARTALLVALQTWCTMLGLLALLTMGTNEVVAHLPMLQQWLGCPICSSIIFTRADWELLVDSATVLFAWRYMANMVTNAYFR